MLPVLSAILALMGIMLGAQVFVSCGAQLKETNELELPNDLMLSVEGAGGSDHGQLLQKKLLIFHAPCAFSHLGSYGHIMLGAQVCELWSPAKETNGLQ